MLRGGGRRESGFVSRQDRDGIAPLDQADGSWRTVALPDHRPFVVQFDGSREMVPSSSGGCGTPLQRHVAPPTPPVAGSINGRFGQPARRDPPGRRARGDRFQSSSCAIRGPVQVTWPVSVPVGPVQGSMIVDRRTRSAPVQVEPVHRNR